MLRRHFKFANVISLVALFVALGGGAYAVTMAPPDSVDSAAIIDGQVNRPDVANGSVDSGAILNEGVKRHDVANQAITGAQVKDGSLTGQQVDGSLTGANVESGSLTPADTSSIVASPNSGDSVSSGDQYQQVVYPLSDASWTQQANELDLVTGRVTYTLPAQCDGANMGTDGLVAVSVDGQGYGQPMRLQEGQTSNVLTASALNLPTPGTATPHTITAKVYDVCSGGGQDVTVNSVDLQVFALR